MQLSLLALYVGILSLPRLHLVLSAPEDVHLCLERFASGLIVLLRTLHHIAPVLVSDPQLAHSLFLLLIDFLQFFVLSLILAHSHEER